jgi:hypothetical protein
MLFDCGLKQLALRRYNVHNHLPVAFVSRVAASLVLLNAAASSEMQN